MEAELLARARQAYEDTDLDDDHRSIDVPLVLVATPTTEGERRLQAVLDNGSSLNLAGLLLGQWRAGGTVRVRDDGTVGATSPRLTGRLAEARLFTLPEADTAALFDLLFAAEPAQENVDSATAPSREDDGVEASVDAGYEFVVANSGTPRPATPGAPGYLPARVVLDLGTTPETTASAQLSQENASESRLAENHPGVRPVPAGS